MSLQIEGISHRFGPQAALSDVSMCVDKGDCYGFIGHNGAGKTTTMRIILGLLRPESGRVVVDGFDAAQYSREARARMGALIETPGFHGGWSGRRNLHLLDRLAGDRSDIDGLLELVGLSHAGDKPVRAYSQGMRQRLGVAQALLGDPDYILLDEPTNGLDPDGIAEMRALLRRLTHDEGKTVLISSHQLHELADTCNRIGVLRQGRLVLQESLESLRMQDRYTLKTTDDARAREILASIEIPVRGEGELVVTISGREPGEVVRRLVTDGVDVDTFAPRPPTLEEIYRGEAHPAPPGPPAEVGPPEQRRAPGAGTLRMLRHEMQRWTGQLTVPILLVLPAVVGVLAMLVRREGVLEDREEVLHGTLASATDVNAFEGVARALHPGVWILCYVVLGLASQSVAGEFAQGTLRNVLLRPLTRLQVVRGKAWALIGAALGSYALLVLAAIGAAAWAFDFTGVTELLPNGNRFELVKADELWPDFWRALMSPVLMLFAYAGIGILAGTLVRRGATALAMALGAGIFLDLGRDVARGSAPEAWLPPTYVPSLGRSSFLDHFLEVSQGTSNTLFVFGDTEVYVPLVWIALTFGLTAFVFSPEVRTVRRLFLLFLLLPACKFLEGQLPTTKPALYDMEEPLALYEEPTDEAQRTDLPAGGFTGAYVTDARQSLEEMDEEPEGVLVQRIVENSPAAAAGLVEGDLIVEVDDKALRWASEWRNAELSARPGQVLVAVYDRAGSDRKARITVAARVHPAERAATERFREEDRVGIVVRTATEVEARGAGLGPGGGAVVVGLSRTSPWRQAGLRFGDVIVEADGVEVAHPNVLLAAIRDAPQEGGVKLVYLRDGKRAELDATVTRREQETKRILVPLLYSYEKDRDLTKVMALFWIYQHKKTPAAYETKIFWIFKWSGGDADRLEEVER